MNHMRTPRRIVLVAAVAGTLAVAGCGGGGGEDFVKSYNEAVAPLQELTTTLQASTTANLSDGKAVDKAAGDLTRMADEFDAVGERLSKLDTPDGAKDELDAFLASLDANSGQIRKVAKAVESRDVQKLADATQDFATEGQKLVAAETALRTAVQ
jgi:hypothetical protein